MGFTAVSQIQRFSRARKKRVLVTRPSVVTKYNQDMCDVDRFDQNVAAYRIGYKGKKCWSSIFTWLIDACLQNAWQLQRKSAEIPQAKFRREVAMYYCKHFGKKPLYKVTAVSVRRRTEAGNMQHTLRFDRMDHYVIPIETRRRCAGDTCGSHVRTQCSKFNVGLCLKCFRSYHTHETQ